MKPTIRIDEIIVEIAKKKWEEIGGSETRSWVSILMNARQDNNYLLSALLDYLDEQYEKEQKIINDAVREDVKKSVALYPSYPDHS